MANNDRKRDRSDAPTTYPLGHPRNPHTAKSTPQVRKAPVQQPVKQPAQQVAAPAAQAPTPDAPKAGA